MKLFLALLLTSALSQFARADDDLAREWRALVANARKDAQVVAASGHTGQNGGVYIQTLADAAKFLDGREGDAALVFYNAAAKRFYAWARAENARKNTSNVSGGEMSTYVRARNGDSLSAVYQPPTTGANQGTVTFVFVDASEVVSRIQNAQ